MTLSIRSKSSTSFMFFPFEYYVDLQNGIFIVLLRITLINQFTLREIEGNIANFYLCFTECTMLTLSEYGKIHLSKYLSKRRLTKIR